MIMKKIIYAAITAALLLNACEYHPYYDGQDFCVYLPYDGLVQDDGCSIYLPIVSEDPYVIELYGGKGRGHSVVIDDPGCLSFTYAEAYVDRSAGDVVPAKVTLIPQTFGSTALTVTDEDTGESVSFHVEICEAYKAMEVHAADGAIEEGSIFVFRYGDTDGVVKICSGSIEDRQVEVIAEGRYEFVAIGKRLCFELSFPAGPDGHPAAGGTEIFRRYVVGYTLGGLLFADSLYMLNLHDLSVTTRSSYSDIIYDSSRYIFFDVTDMDPSLMDSLVYDPYYDGTGEDPADAGIMLSEEEFFCADAAEIFPWIF